MLAGDDTVWAGEVRKRLLREHFDGPVEPGALAFFNAGADDPAALENSLESLSLFSRRRAVVIYEAEKLTKKRFPDFAERLKDLEEDVLVVLLTEKSERELSGLEWVEALARRGAAAFFPAPRNDRAAEEWVAGFCARRKIRIERAAVRKIVEEIGHEPWELAAEILKTAFAVEGGIHVRDVQEYIEPHRKRGAFEWAEAVMAGSDRALSLAAQATNYGQECEKAIGALFFLFSNIERLEARQGLPQWQRRSAESGRRSWTKERRRKGRAVLWELDLTLKRCPSEFRQAYFDLTTAKLLEIVHGA